jgi:ABC-type Zn uptake system ZnuABC Zn-binding protein ZnuA
VDEWAAGFPSQRSLELLPRLDPVGGDPHWWQDPVRVERAVKQIRNELARADVHGAGYYEAASADYMARLRRLDAQIRSCLEGARISAERLTAAHPGFAYFSARYGVPIVRARRATVGRRLWADNLGPVGTRADSYLGAMSENTAAIVDALSGGRDCRPRP